MTTTTLQSNWRHFFEAWRELNRLQFVSPWARDAKRR